MIVVMVMFMVMAASTSASSIAEIWAVHQVVAVFFTERARTKIHSILAARIQ